MVPMLQIDYEEYLEFIEKLNREEESIIIVEGKNDRKALEFWGITLPIITFRGPVFRFVESLEMRYSTRVQIILLLDFDKEGKRLNKELKQAFLEKGFKVNTHFWLQLMRFGVTYVEGLTSKKFLEAIECSKKH